MPIWTIISCEVQVHLNPLAIINRIHTSEQLAHEARIPFISPAQLRFATVKLIQTN